MTFQLFAVFFLWVRFSEAGWRGLQSGRGHIARFDADLGDQRANNVFDLRHSGLVDKNIFQKGEIICEDILR